MVVIKRGQNCHKDLSGVMANAGFGTMKVRGTDGQMYAIPSRCIKKNDGCLKKSWRAIFFQEMGYAIPA